MYPVKFLLKLNWTVANTANLLKQLTLRWRVLILAVAPWHRQLEVRRIMGRKNRKWWVMKYLDEKISPVDERQ